MPPEPPDAAPAEPAMDPQTRAELAAAFTDQQVAVAYDARPSYPRAAVDWMVGTREPRRVLDLGAGTGKLTEVLVVAGHDVVAVDVSDAMLRQLTERLAGVETAVGSAEHIPVPDRSVDVVMVAQAFHWFDPEPSLREIARVLRTTGTLALVWNIRDESAPGVREMSRALGGLQARVASAGALSDAAAFGPVSEAEFSIAQRLDRAGFGRLALSRSYVWKLPRDEQARTLSELDGIFDRHSVDGVLTIPYVTRCYRASPV